MENQVSSTTPTGRSALQFCSGAQWGLASLIIGSVVFVASPVLLVFNTIFMGVRHQVPIGLAWVASLIRISPSSSRLTATIPPKDATESVSRALR